MTTEVTRNGSQMIAARYLDAEPSLVWTAFTTPEHLASFWGGDHATVSSDSVEVDLRVGGAFALETRGADGTARALRFTYAVVDAPTRLVLTEPSSGITTDIRLQPTGRGTTVTIRQTRLPPELQTEQARNGLAGIVERLAKVVGQLINSMERTGKHDHPDRDGRSLPGRLPSQ